MIIQGDNHPTIMTIDTDISAWDSVSVGLYSIDGKLLKQWEQSDLSYSSDEDKFFIVCNWSQNETSVLPAGKVYWLIKAKDPDSLNQFWDEVQDTVKPRYDRSVVL